MGPANAFLSLSRSAHSPSMVVSILSSSASAEARGDGRPLKLPDFAALPVNLCAHALDFRSELVKLHHGLAWLSWRIAGTVGAIA